MALQTSLDKRVFHFNFNARTSRGAMQEKVSWFVKLWDDAADHVIGIGECGPLQGLSVDDRPDLDSILRNTLLQFEGRAFEQTTLDDVMSLLPEEFPSIRFAIETAWLDLVNGGQRTIFNNDFHRGTPIAINGLIWMGDLDFTISQIDKKVQQGFSCIKLKVGGLDFDKECGVLAYIRKQYANHKITLRLDANGAFTVDDALLKLKALSKFDIHSIEQPIKPGLPEMEVLCRTSPIAIALDEELIGVKSSARISLLHRLKPQYIILKPSLHGGLSGSAEWISIAEHLGIGWWITSALESNIGLNAICQFTANYVTNIPQGLGTGAIYENNIASPLEVVNGQIRYNADKLWDNF
ncbi:o-succinylbenzoate synthase [Pseudochryseolinea flava]|uniref:O-succinylbenzoate synthase n=1 Tax=Pseudochryseolinea flava TaxID=2059302 RepID=A0A364XXL7_9BACT|nr:o-succinylbenzoate synthase [Pseudochryseolinea flava]RAV99188.1 o-succinylbenzoate synthase [Pseudochryseolinea flava]